MRHLIRLLALVCVLGATPAHAQLNKAAMAAAIASCFPTQTVGAITPAGVVTCLTTLLNSYQQFPSVNAQTGTSYTVLTADYGKLLTFSNGSAISVTLPQANGAFCPFNFYVNNLGTGTVTITPTSSTINGAGSLNLTSGQQVWVVSDCTNYQIGNISTPSSGGSTITAGSTVYASGVSGQCAYDNGGILGNFPCASLTATDQTLAGGANVTVFNPTAGNVALDCGTQALQYVFNVGNFNITAPTADGSCVLKVINASGSGASVGNPTLVNFSPKSPQGGTFFNNPTASAVSVTFTNANPTVISWTAHGLKLNSPVYFTASVMPTGISANVVYYVSTVVGANSFQIQTAPVSTTTAGIAATSTGTTVVGNAPSVWDLSVTRAQGSTLGVWIQEQ